jgi:hypothetical protein
MVQSTGPMLGYQPKDASSVQLKDSSPTSGILELAQGERSQRSKVNLVEEMSPRRGW